jgi:hypothetical protein
MVVVWVRMSSSVRIDKRNVASLEEENKIFIER